MVKSIARAAQDALSRTKGVRTIAQAAKEALEIRTRRHLVDQEKWLFERFGFTQAEFEAQGFHIRHGANLSYVGDFEIEMPNGAWVDLGYSLADLGILIRNCPELVRGKAS